MKVEIMNKQGKLSARLCVVTGAGGFIGSHLVEKLLSHGAKVKSLVHYNALGAIGHLESAKREYIDSGQLEIVAGDVCDLRCMQELINGVDVVFHLAALIGIPYSYVAPESYLRTNAQGTLNVLEACRNAGVSRVLHTSTSETYGTARSTPMNECHLLQGQSPYSASKIAADKLAESYALSFDLPVTTVRPFNTYGPRQSMRAVIPSIIAQALNADCEVIRLGSLDPIRDLTFVKDTVRAYVEISSAPIKVVSGRLYNLGVGIGFTISEVAEHIQSIVGTKKESICELERIRPTKSEVFELISDASRIKREVGWKAKISLDEGLRETVEWMKNNLPDIREATKYTV
jgi:NAD dependent epimerase/dehydratase